MGYPVWPAVAARVRWQHPRAVCKGHEKSGRRGSAAKAAQIKACSSGRQKRGLTPRSSRAPTAGHQAPATGTVYIFCGRGLVSHRWCRLTSNVRHRKMRASRHFRPCQAPAFFIPKTSLRSVLVPPHQAPSEYLTHGAPSASFCPAAVSCQHLGQFRGRSSSFPVAPFCRGQYRVGRSSNAFIAFGS